MVREKRFSESVRRKYTVSKLYGEEVDSEYLLSQIEWYKEIEELLIFSIQCNGSSEAVDAALDMKRMFLRGVNIKNIEDYLAYTRPLALPVYVLIKILDEAYMLQSKR